jgi:hypothetical protein
MNPPLLLSTIEARLEEISALRKDALATVLDLAAGRMQADHELRREIVSRFQGYEHEYWTAAQVKLDLISAGRTETRFDGGVPKTAVVIPENAPASLEAIRGASRVPSSEAPQQPFTRPSPGGPPPANLPPEEDYQPANAALVEELTHSFAAGDVF